jgi:transposase
MDTKLAKAAPKRTHRRHDREFKAQVIEACLRPGVSVAGVALANGLNANYLRRWVKEHREQGAGKETDASVTTIEAKATKLVPVKVDTSVVGDPEEIRVDIRRGQTAVQMAWPVGHTAALGECLRELLR